ncbi:hypothetical protein RCO28_34320 [Streptomyces sp. LHD-70]|uniref:hypothetical protein n=1 Tax=Streptomyces sp. LHD-70 TaxID=3072140 RepID=UPI00280C7E3C|nr:hypothetical protein [Streptomyces sp. LHD-70]MDQ8707508.1 hypothetical protein [Streptomyces sp. LHD-70]
MCASSSVPESDCGRTDAAVDALVSWCGWLIAGVFVVGFAHGWWWGGDLTNLPLIGESAARAATERRGWPWVPVLTALCGAFLLRRAWCALAGLALGRPARRGTTATGRR